MNTARAILDTDVTEQQWQRTVMEAAAALGWLCHHTYDSRRSEPGLPDLFLVRERVIWAELKTQRGRLSREQADWIAALRAAGQEVYVWRPSDWGEVEAVLGCRPAPR